VPNVRPKDPEELSKEATKYDLEYHFQRWNVTTKTQELYLELDQEITSIDESIWVKYAQTAITYYSPEKVFVYLKFRRRFLSLNIFTDKEIIEGVQNIKDHENWGILQIKN
jgi:predicted transport protein